MRASCSSPACCNPTESVGPHYVFAGPCIDERRSTVESLWFGVPTVAIPQAVDQFTNAAQLEAIGAGVQLPTKDVDPEALRTAVAAALARKPRALELRSEVRRVGGVAIAANAVERLCVVPPDR